MARMWINNVSDETSDADLVDFIGRYGFPPPASSSSIAGALPQRRAVVLTFDGIDEETLRRLQPRIHGVFFQGSTLHVQVAPPARKG